MEAVRYRRKPDAVAERELGDTLMLVPVTAHLGRLDRFFNLNEAAGLIWHRTLDGATLDEVTDTLCDTYEVERETARLDAQAVLEQLVDFGALESEPTG